MKFTILGALKELIEGNGLREVVLQLDFLLANPDELDCREEVDGVPVSMQVDVSFPRRTNLGEQGVTPAELYPNDN